MNTKENAWANAYADFVIRNRWAIIILLIIATVVAALQIHKLDIRNDPDTLLPPSNRYVATNLYAEHNFGMGNLMVFALKIKEGDIWQPWFINKVQEIHNKLDALPHSRSANFIDIAAQKIKYMGTDENGLVFKRLIPTEGISDDPAKAQEQLAFLREGVKNNPVMAPMLVSMWDADGNRCAYEDYDKDHCVAKAAYVIADYTDEVKAIYLPWVREVRAMMDEYGQDDRIELLVAGEPYFLAWMLADLLDKWWLFAISIAIVLAVLWMEFRNWRGSLFPLLGVGMTVAMTLGLMGFTEFKLTTMMVLTPMLLLAIGIGHSVQVTRRFMLENGRSGDANSAARESIRHTIIPATLSIITDMVGFATLATVDISFYKAYAYFGMFGMLTLLATTTTLIPLLLTVFPPSKECCQSQEGHGWEVGVGGFLTRLISGPGKWVPIARRAAGDRRFGVLHQSDELAGQPGRRDQAGRGKRLHAGCREGHQLCPRRVQGQLGHLERPGAAQRDHAGRHLGRDPDPRQGGQPQRLYRRLLPRRDLRHRGSAGEGQGLRHRQKPAGLLGQRGLWRTGRIQHGRAAYRSGEDGKLDAGP